MEGLGRNLGEVSTRMVAAGDVSQDQGQPQEDVLARSHSCPAQSKRSRERAREALERARAECGDELEDEVEEEDSWLQAA